MNELHTHIHTHTSFHPKYKKIKIHIHIHIHIDTHTHIFYALLFGCSVSFCLYVPNNLSQRENLFSKLHMTFIE
jgi:hypothetical protein